MDEEKVSAEPLFTRIRGKGGASAFAEKLNVSEQVVSNWKRRGVPWRKLPKVAAALGISVERYLEEAGYPSVRALTHTPEQHTLEASALMEDFLALPDGLREYVARKAAELRKYADALPKFIRDALMPPSDPERYRAWERDIEADMLAKTGGKVEATPTPPSLGRLYGPGPSQSRKTTKPKKRER
jgi:hypothetical protein